MNVQPVKVLLADDHTMVREGLAALIGNNSQVQVIGQCGDGLQVVKQVEELKPDVVVLDISMPGTNGLDICRELSKKVQGVAVLILTMHDSEQFISKAMQNGARGYLIKDAAPAQLTEAILAVARGEKFLGAWIPQAMLNPGAQSDSYDRLTPRERQVLQLIAESKTNRQIAHVLKLSVKTVDTHRSHLMRKLGIHDQTSLVKFVLRRGLVRLD